MTHDPNGTQQYPVPFIALIPFLLMAFGLAWGIIALYIIFPELMTTAFGQLSGHHPLFILAVWSPAIAAVVMIIRYAGLVGLRRYLSRLLLWHCHPAWYGFLLGVPLLFYAGAAVKGNLTDPFPFTSGTELLVAIAITLILGPMEEFGWRGLALPLLQRRFAPFWAALILGSIWGIWHLPAFLLSGTPQSAWLFTPFLLGSVALSLIVTPLFNSSQGSILFSYLFHWQLINPIWPDAQPYDIVFFWIAALVIIVINRKTMFRKNHAITRVIPLAMPMVMPGHLSEESDL